MENFKEINILKILKESPEIKLIGYRNNKEEVIELDSVVKSMLIGYFSKKIVSDKKI